MKLKYLTCICILPLSMSVAYAQSPQSVLDKFKSEHPFLALENAALLKGIKMPGLGVSELGYLQDEGSLKHPFDAGSRKGIRFSAIRAHSLKNWDFYGTFSFKSYKEKEVALTEMANPFRDNPYQVADSLSGEWNKQNYRLDARIAAPAFMNGKLTAGLGIGYEVLTGARQKDPRPLDNSNQLELKPGIAYQLTPKSFLGLNGSYENYREDLTVELYNNRQVYNIYKLLGLGEYEFSSPVLLSSGVITRSYLGNQLGGNLQYGYNEGRLNVLASAGYTRHEEDVTDGTTYPQKGGRHSFNEYAALIALSWSGRPGFQQILFNWEQRDIDNREYHQVQNSGTKEYETVYTSIFNTNLKTRSTLSYLLNRRRQNKLIWSFRAGAGYSGLDNRYANPKSLEIIDKFDGSLAFTRYIELKKAASLSFGIGSRYEFIHTDRLEYTEKSYSSNYIAHNIFIPIHAFLSVPSWNNQLQLQYTFGPFAKSSNQLYIKAQGYLNAAMKAGAGIEKGNTRQGFLLSLGLYN